MSRMLTIALNDLRLFLRDRPAWFWLFGSPLLFAFFMGFANRGPGSPANPKPRVVIENHDAGFMGGIFLKELGMQGLQAVTNGQKNVEAEIQIPAGFTSNLLGLKPVKIELKQVNNSGAPGVSLVEMKVLRAVVALNGHLVEQASSESNLSRENLEAILGRGNPVSLDASFATRRPLPTGYNQAVPGILVMFIMMNLLIFGGATVVSERREGVLKRLLVQPITLRELVFGKIVGLMLLGLVQILFLLLAGKLIMKMDYAGSLPLILLTTSVLAWAAASLGLLAGSVIPREEIVVAVCVMASLVMAALGGCWWPLEIVPDKVRAVGHLFPTAWAMDALHQLISFGGGLAQIQLPLVLLGGFAVAATICSIRFFRVS